MSNPGRPRNAACQQLHLYSQTFERARKLGKGNSRTDLCKKSVHDDRGFVRPAAVASLFALTCASAAMASILTIGILSSRPDAGPFSECGRRRPCPGRPRMGFRRLAELGMSSRLSQLLYLYATTVHRIYARKYACDSQDDDGPQVWSFF